MKAVQKQLGILTLLLSCAAAQDTASQRVTIQNIAVVRDRGDLRVEVTLSSPVRPSIELAHHPDRLLVQLPNTKDRSRQGKIEVNSNGVRTVHTVLALEDGTSTNIVVELDHARPYVWSSDRNRIVLTFSSVASAQERSARDTTTAASSAGLSEAGQHQATLQSTGSSKSAPSIIPAASPAVSSGRIG